MHRLGAAETADSNDASADGGRALKGAITPLQPSVSAPADGCLSWGGSLAIRLGERCNHLHDAGGKRARPIADNVGLCLLLAAAAGISEDSAVAADLPKKKRRGGVEEPRIAPPAAVGRC